MGKVIPLAKRLNDKLNKQTKAGCWNWLGHTDKSGHGRINKDGKLLGAHRVAYEFANGPIPEGLVVRHKCDNSRCCNPEHLVLGTHKDNMRDMAERERAKHTRLTAMTVREIRGKIAEGLKIGQLAADYDVSESAVQHIKQNRTWKHVT